MTALPPLPFGSTWHENLYGIPAAEANIILLADGRVLCCEDAAELLDWSKADRPERITHWTRVLPVKIADVLQLTSSCP